MGSADLTVEELKVLIADRDELIELLEEEQARGDDTRDSAVDALQKRLAELDAPTAPQTEETTPEEPETFDTYRLPGKLADEVDPEDEDAEPYHPTGYTVALAEGEVEFATDDRGEFTPASNQELEAALYFGAEKVRD